MRIYIIGAAGSGKTTLANRISEKKKTKCYHLDDIFYADEKGSRRNETERNELFLNIINKPEWIAEDNGGRICFIKALDKADSIILLYPNKYIRIKRIILRYIKQKSGLEKCNYKPGLKLLKRMLNGSSRFESGDDGVKKSIAMYRNKALILKTKKDIDAFIDSFQL